MKLFYLPISFCSFRRGPKNVLINAVRLDVDRSCLLNVGANNVASVYRENRKSQKAIAIKNARRRMRARENCRVIRGVRSSISPRRYKSAHHRCSVFNYPLLSFSRLEFIIGMAAHQTHERFMRARADDIDVNYSDDERKECPLIEP